MECVAEHILLDSCICFHQVKFQSWVVTRLLRYYPQLETRQSQLNKLKRKNKSIEQSITMRDMLIFAQQDYGTMVSFNQKTCEESSE